MLEAPIVSNSCNENAAGEVNNPSSESFHVESSCGCVQPGINPAAPFCTYIELCAVMNGTSTPADNGSIVFVSHPSLHGSIATPSRPMPVVRMNERRELFRGIADL